MSLMLTGKTVFGSLYFKTVTPQFYDINLVLQCTLTERFFLFYLFFLGVGGL